jgi:hypothetical protein
MARASAILKALYTAFRRDWRSFGSLAVNNFFPISALFLQKAGTFVYLIIGLVILFPASTDPLRKIPASRLALWPLESRERLILRLASPWINPMTWILAGLAIWAARGRITAGLWAAVAGLFAAGFLLSELPPVRGLWRAVPNFPGRLNQLIRKNVREILSTLDFYCALLLSLSAVAFRIAGRLPDEARLNLAILVLLALSSYTQCLFGLDGDGGLSRYRLLPIRGWQLLAAKDAAFLVMALVLLLPLAPLPGTGAALICLALGHGPSVEEPREQLRWRFSSGVSVLYGVVQVVAMAGSAAAIAFAGRWVFLLCVAVWGLSLGWYGAKLESQGSYTPTM